MKKKFTLLLLSASMLLATKSFSQCAAPVNLAVSFGNNTSVFTWDTVPGATSYNLEIKFSYSTEWQSLADSITTNSFSQVGLFQSATFNWRIVSICSPTDFAYSSSQTYIVPCESPNTPVAANITGTTATVSWTPAPVNPQLSPSFTVSYRILGSTGAWTVATSNTSATSVNLSGLSSNITYEWCVNKLCSYFNSAPLFGQFTTQYIPCDIPVNLRTVSATSNTVSLAWDQVNGYANYTVQFKKASNTNWTTVNTTSNSFTRSNLSKETLYDWRVMASCTNASQSVYAPVKQFTTYSNPCMAYGNNANEGIDYFSLGSISRVSGKEIGGYFRSTLSTDLVKGSTNNLVTISVVYPAGISYGDYFAVYIDYNKNGTFTDVGEQVIAPLVQITSQSSNYTANFSVPTTVSTGATKMRVILRRPGSVIIPCATGFQGEVEDYNVNIVNTGNFTSNNSITSKAMNTEDDNSTVEVSAWPNPSKGVFNVTLPNNLSGGRYEIINSNGSIVKSSSISLKTNLQVDLSNYTKGMYILKLYGINSEAKVVKLIVQ